MMTHKTIQPMGQPILDSGRGVMGGIANGVVATGTDIGVHGISAGGPTPDNTNPPPRIGVFGQSTIGTGVFGLSGRRSAFPGGALPSKVWRDLGRLACRD